LQQAAVQLDATYITPVETHNPMEMHGTIAVWDKGKLTLYENYAGGREPPQRGGADAV